MTFLLYPSLTCTTYYYTSTEHALPHQRQRSSISEDDEEYVPYVSLKERKRAKVRWMNIDEYFQLCNFSTNRQCQSTRSNNVSYLIVPLVQNLVGDLSGKSVTSLKTR